MATLQDICAEQGIAIEKLLEFALRNLETSKQEISFLKEEREILSRKVNMQQTLLDAEHQYFQQRLQTNELMHKERELTQAYEIAKTNLLCGADLKDALLLKLKLDSALDDLEELQTRYEFLMLELKEEQVKAKALNKGSLEKEKEIQTQRILELEQRTRALQESLCNMEKDHVTEIAKVKDECKRISSLRKNEVSALLREKDFVWNQLKRMEEDYGNHLKRKTEQLQDASENIEKLRIAMDELQKANNEKDVELTVMKVELGEKEREVQALKENVSKHSEPSKSLQESRPAENISTKSKGRRMNVLSVQDACGVETNKVFYELNAVHQTYSQENNTEPQALNENNISYLDSIPNKDNKLHSAACVEKKVSIQDGLTSRDHVFCNLNTELNELAIYSDLLKQPPANETLLNKSPHVDDKKGVDGMDRIQYPQGINDNTQLKCDDNGSSKHSKSPKEIATRNNSSNKRRRGSQRSTSLESLSQSASWERRNLRPRGKQSDESSQLFGQIVKYNESMQPVRPNFFPSSFSIPKVKVMSRLSPFRNRWSRALTEKIK
ncbi:uncharacterized protein LOC131067790 isoform X2 [Cryptomeria japonica]|uniref:uncharacterized protein LOC131067790 isoform X2 n=1 Tax=Cryptomeria japonica TaxID=3369 RepID=UPI0027DA3E2F|nr:uncharacterized protein LOC131067790 isoform X2 [Cryptomeria japonica]